MPRGFLVKRTRRPCGSYRIPCEDNGPPQSLPSSSVVEVLVPDTPIAPPNAEITGEERPRAPHQVSPTKAREQLGPWTPRPCSPAQPGGLEMKTTFLKRYLSSPAAAQSFPVAASFTPMEKLLAHHHPFLTPEAKLPANLCARDPARPSKPPAKRHKASRKLHFADHVTTSPVLGLKIKAEEPDAALRSPLVRRPPPLGEFICQLCKEQYPDPFALAQHKCSRIVRVEYRCPECDKMFSCPANLASHRRWHKPRAPGSDGGKKAPLEGKENSSGRIASLSGIEQDARFQHQESADSSALPAQHLRTGNSSALPAQHLRTGNSSALPAQHLRTGNSSFQNREDSEPAVPQPPSQEEEEAAFHCPICYKRFRRHAYLRKHLLTHQPYSALERAPLPYPCALCGIHFPSMDIRDKHRLWHAVREELLLPLEDALVAEGGQQIFPCELCPTAFFSSPGLSLHMSKCHSSDNRHDLLPPPIPLGPGC